MFMLAVFGCIIVGSLVVTSPIVWVAIILGIVGDAWMAFNNHRKYNAQKANENGSEAE